MSNSNSTELRSITQSALRSTNNHTISTQGNRLDTKFFKKPYERTLEGEDITVSKFPDILGTERGKETEKIPPPSGKIFKINKKLQNVARIRENFLKVKKDLLGIDTFRNSNLKCISEIKNNTRKESNRTQETIIDHGIKNTVVLSSTSYGGYKNKIIHKNYTTGINSSSIVNNLSPETSVVKNNNGNSMERSPSLIKIEYNKSIKDFKVKNNFSTINSDKPDTHIKLNKLFNSTSRSNFKDDTKYKQKLMNSGLDTKKVIKGKLIKTFAKNFVIDKDSMYHLNQKFTKTIPNITNQHKTDFRCKNNIGIITQKAPDVLNTIPAYSPRFRDLYITPEEMINTIFSEDELKVVKTDLAYFSLNKKPYKDMKILEAQNMIDIIKKEENLARSKNSIIKENMGMEKRVKSYLENLLNKIERDPRKDVRKSTIAVDGSPMKHFNIHRKPHHTLKDFYGLNELRSIDNSHEPVREIVITQSRDNVFLTKQSYETKMKNYEERRKVMSETAKCKFKNQNDYHSLVQKKYKLNKSKERDEAYFSNLYLNIIKDNYTLKK